MYKKMFSHINTSTNRVGSLKKLPTSLLKLKLSGSNKNWKQLKKQFPKLNPNGDLDGDRVINKLDCQPLNTMRQDAITLKSYPIYQTLYNAGNVSPSQKIRTQGYVYGFSSPQYAISWAKKNNLKHIYKFITNNYNIDSKIYSRLTPAGTVMSDNEYIAKNVVQEQRLR